jgi:flagellar hook protein FlgE
MSRASDSFDAAAARLARTGQSANNAPGASTSATTDGSDTVDLSSSVVSLLEARDNFEANTKTVAVSDQMTQATLNMVG